MRISDKKGFTLVETLVSMAVFAIIALGVYQAFIASISLIRVSNLMIESAALANEQFEIAHNLPYDDVGTVSGIPSGKLASSRIVNRSRADFLVQTTVRNIDDPFDGTLGGAPNDTSPADYKLIEVKVSMPYDPSFKPLSYSKIIAPKALENASTNGALFIRVIDANGQPVSGADVHIENNQTLPPIVIDDITNNNGYLQIVDAPPGIEAYEISVSKAGHSQERTYRSGEVANPNPIKKHSTVAAQTVTEMSFAIDLTGTVNVETVTDTCLPVGNVGFDLKGAKLIGSSPDILKYESSSLTDASGIESIPGMEWDSYTMTVNDTVYHLAGSISMIPFNLNPGSSQDIKVVVAPKDPMSLLMSVKQGGTNLPLSEVKITLDKGTSSRQLITGRGFLRQTDWSGGSGQNDFIDQSKYFYSDTGIEDNLPAGEVKLKDIFGSYATNGFLVSSIFDTGSASNFYQLDFLPHDQPIGAGTSSVRFKIATNNDKSTWNFLGPDGSTSTFYTLSDLNINPAHNGDRYFRYQLHLSTASSTHTPNVTEVSFTFSSLCVPSGQAIFNGLDAGTYSITASKIGYQTLSDSIDISSPWVQKEIVLMPE
jgi:prepilin-type N-terminal cleavage/methylation domain-containing protein